jgi:hypothetical protein
MRDAESEVEEVAGVPDGNNLEVGGQLTRRARLEAGKIRSHPELGCQEVRMVAVEDLNREYHWAAQ